MSSRTSRGHPPPTSLKSPLNILFDHHGDFPGTSFRIGILWMSQFDVRGMSQINFPGASFRRRFQNFPHRTFKRRLKDVAGIVCCMSLIFVLLFSSIFFNWPSLSKHNKNFSVFRTPSNFYVGICISIFAKLPHEFLQLTYFVKKLHCRS